MVKESYVDKCLDVGVSILFRWIESHVPLPFRILTAPIEHFIRRRIRKKLERVFKRVELKSNSKADYMLVSRLTRGLRPCLGDYREAVNAKDRVL